MRFATATMLSVLIVGPAFAQSSEAPPENAIPASEIVARVEAREGFAYLGRIELARGEYSVVYYMSDGAEVSVDYDPATGEPVQEGAEEPERP